MPPHVYKRIILKLSGDILKGNQETGIDFTLVNRIAAEIFETHQDGLEIGVVIGGGNLVRGSDAEQLGYSRITADTMGMLSTVINSLALQDALESLGAYARVLSAIEIRELVEPFIRRRAIRHLEKHRIVIMAAGTGNPYFTTDTAAALRASQLGAEVILKGTRVDGVFDRDPFVEKDAVMFDKLDYMEIIRRGLRVMDLTAITFARDNQIPILVFNILKPNNLRHIVCGGQIGTLVSEVDSG